MASIAFLGTGALGSGFVKAACERGLEVVVWNPEPMNEAKP